MDVMFRRFQSYIDAVNVMAWGAVFMNRVETWKEGWKWTVWLFLGWPWRIKDLDRPVHIFQRWTWTWGQGQMFATSRRADLCLREDKRLNFWKLCIRCSLGSDLKSSCQLIWLRWNCVVQVFFFYSPSRRTKLNRSCDQWYLWWSDDSDLGLILEKSLIKSVMCWSFQTWGRRWGENHGKSLFVWGDIERIKANVCNRTLFRVPMLNGGV